MSLRAELSEQHLQQRWETFVKPALFAGRTPSAQPTVILIGGQPGCGKTLGLNHVLAMYPDESFVPIIGDDLRPYHPDHQQALHDPDETVMPAITAQASGAWVRKGIEHAAAHGYNTVVEGTFRNPQTTLDTAGRFAAAGHQVHVVALAVPEDLSRLSCLERYYGERAAGNHGRWTPPAAHDLGYEGTPGTVEAAENDPAVHRLTVMDRAANVLYDNTRGPDGQWHQPLGARQALEARRAQPFTAEETDQWLSTAGRVQQWAAQVGISPQARDALQQIQVIATRLEALRARPDAQAETAGRRRPGPVKNAEDSRDPPPRPAEPARGGWRERPHGAVRTAALPSAIDAAEREAARLSDAAQRRTGEAQRLRDAAEAGQGPALRALEERRTLLDARLAAATDAASARAAAEAQYATSRQAWRDIAHLDAEAPNPRALRRPSISRADIAAEQQRLRETALNAVAEAQRHEAHAEQRDQVAGGLEGARSAAVELEQLTTQWDQHAAQAVQQDITAARQQEQRAATEHTRAARAQQRASELRAEAQHRATQDRDGARREEADRDAQRTLEREDPPHSL